MVPDLQVVMHAGRKEQTLVSCEDLQVSAAVLGVSKRRFSSPIPPGQPRGHTNHGHGRFGAISGSSAPSLLPTCLSVTVK